MDYAEEARKRAEWIRETVAEAGAKGVIFGNSGGKDSALVAILCKMAAQAAARDGGRLDVLGVMMPCGSKVNYGTDLEHAKALAQAFAIENITVDLTPARDALLRGIAEAAEVTQPASANIHPRLRMTTLYAIAQSRGLLVAGTGNRSEIYTGYFTKWGDGGCDLNPIADVAAGEVPEFLRHLGAPAAIADKPPSAGLFEGQTDEADMGVSYAAIDRFIQTGEADAADAAIISRMHRQTAHKRRMPKQYGYEGGNA